MSTQRMKSLAGILLVAIAVSATAIGLRREAGQAAPAPPADEGARSALEGTPPAPAEALAEPVAVFYFHGDTRCVTCRAIESRTAAAVQERFAEELASDRLRFESVNFEAPEGRHFQEAYELAFGTVVVQGTGEERPWENLSEVWTLVRDPSDAFETYITEHVRRMLEEAR